MKTKNHNNSYKNQEKLEVEHDGTKLPRFAW